MHEKFHIIHSSSFHSDKSGKFDIVRLAPSVLDWLALWKSDVSLILHGAFAWSSAVGSGKLCYDFCDPGEVEGRTTGQFPNMKFLICAKPDFYSSQKLKTGKSDVDV